MKSPRVLATGGEVARVIDLKQGIPKADKEGCMFSSLDAKMYVREENEAENRDGRQGHVELRSCLHPSQCLRLLQRIRKAVRFSVDSPKKGRVRDRRGHTSWLFQGEYRGGEEDGVESQSTTR